MRSDVPSFPTPLIRLSRFVQNGIVFAKGEHLQPTGSVYDRIALLLLEAHAAELGERGVAIVAGSGSLCLSFAAAAARFPSELVVVCPASTLAEHKKLLEGHRATVVFSDATLGLRGAHARALEEQVRRKAVLLHSPLSSAAAERVFASTVGAELAEQAQQISGPFSVVAPLGSGALLRGVGSALEARGRRAELLGTVRARDERQGWQDGVVAEDEASHVSGVELIAVADQDAYQARSELARSEGLLIGMSSAAALHAALVRASSGVPVVAIAVDAGDRYFSVDHHFRGAR